MTTYKNFIVLFLLIFATLKLSSEDIDYTKYTSKDFPKNMCEYVGVYCSTDMKLLIPAEFSKLQILNIFTTFGYGEFGSIVEDNVMNSLKIVDNQIFHSGNQVIFFYNEQNLLNEIIRYINLKNGKIEDYKKFLNSFVEKFNAETGLKPLPKTSSKEDIAYEYLYKCKDKEISVLIELSTKYPTTIYHTYKINRVADIEKKKAEIKALEDNQKVLQKEIKDITKKIKKNPKDWNPYYVRAVAYIKLRDFNNALKDFDMSIKLKPDYYANYQKRGYVKSELKDFQGAISDFTSAYTIAPDLAKGDMLIQRAEVKIILGNINDACNDLKLAQNTSLEVYLANKVRKMLSESCR